MVFTTLWFISIIYNNGSFKLFVKVHVQGKRTLGQSVWSCVQQLAQSSDTQHGGISQHVQVHSVKTSKKGGHITARDSPGGGSASASHQVLYQELEHLRSTWHWHGWLLIRIDICSLCWSFLCSLYCSLLCFLVLSLVLSRMFWIIWECNEAWKPLTRSRRGMPSSSSSWHSGIITQFLSEQNPLKFDILKVKSPACREQLQNWILWFAQGPDHLAWGRTENHEPLKIWPSPHWQ